MFEEKKRTDDDEEDEDNDTDDVMMIMKTMMTMTMWWRYLWHKLCDNDDDEDYDAIAAFIPKIERKENFSSPYDSPM